MKPLVQEMLACSGIQGGHCVVWVEVMMGDGNVTMYSDNIATKS